MSFRYLRPLARFFLDITEAGSSSAHRYRLRTVAFAGGVGYVVGITSVFGIGYGVYYYSDLKKKIDTLSPALDFLGKASRTLLDEQPSPNAALQCLRQAAKAYLSYIPGAGLLIDAMFNHIDQIVEGHTEQANSIITAAYVDMNKIINHDGNKHETHTAMEILAVCKRLAKDLGALGVEAATPYVNVMSAAAGSVIEAVKNKSPDWKAELDRKTEPIETAVGSVVGAVRSNLSPEWKQSASTVTGAIRNKIHPQNQDKDEKS